MVLRILVKSEKLFYLRVKSEKLEVKSYFILSVRYDES
jgi:hypothetical protein